MQETSTDRVINFIRSEGMTPGDRLPAEIAMAQLLGLSRNSVREAYSELLARGMLTRRHGIGTFVAEPPIMNSMGNNVGFWKLIEQSKMTPAVRELNRGKAELPDAIASLMGLEPGRAVDSLRWLFLANGEPCVLIDHFLAPHASLELIDPDVTPNVMHALRDQIVVEGATLTTQSSATNATLAIAGLLNVPEGEALLTGMAAVKSGDGTVILASRSWHNPKLINNRTTSQLSAMHFLHAANNAPNNASQENS
ncbi:GntR family transcriptional regulator [Alloyangia pacifica]|uniref:GntR family transcriptional regulator n=1 Tax=Alloyangia pacifica TaxID=311180 RepID=UPI001CD500F9|nr:GntR family transcriptional regulator [Alloyangia pacifica]MCA0994946.1 GntR family transcriptional regulator [Alloyangia pacifica]